MKDDDCANCGCPKDCHTARATVPFTNTACVYALDADNPCWCMRYVPPIRDPKDLESA